MNLELWSSGLEDELSFWRDWLETKGAQWPNDFIFRTNPNTELQPELAQLFADFHGIPKILDVGAGPMTRLGKKLNGVIIDITAVDALAERYNELNFPAGLPILRTQKCETERLTERFAANSFDMTHAVNTLDHSYDPIVAIKEMIKVTKPGGVIVTSHAANEADHGNWGGLHQWNFHVKHRDLKISNKADTLSVSQEIQGVASITSLSPDSSDWVFCVLRKL